MLIEKLKHGDLTSGVIKSSYAVHNILGNGFQEVIYQRCMAIELAEAGLGFTREQEHTIYYNGIDVGTRRADFVVEDRVW